MPRAWAQDFFIQLFFFDGFVDANEVLVYNAAGADIHMPYFRISHLSLRQSYRESGSLELAVGIFLYRELMKGVFALSIADTALLVAMPQPSKIISNTFLVRWD